MVAPTERDERSWVLLEARRAQRPALLHELQSLGRSVLVCSGPTEDRPCPLVDGGTCELVDHAPVVVNALGTSGTDADVAEAVVERACASVVLGSPEAVAAISERAVAVAVDAGAHDLAAALAQAELRAASTDEQG